MGYYTADPYNEPEKFGLTFVAEVDDKDASYSFNKMVVWRRDSDGKLFWAADSGCSCPSPFEGYNAVEDLSPLPEKAEEFIDSLTRHESYSCEGLVNAEGKCSYKFCKGYLYDDGQRLDMRKAAQL